MNASPLFAGYPPYLESAARRIGHPEAALLARHIPALTALAQLCAQATIAPLDHVPDILGKAEEFLHQLRVASEAAEAILADVRRRRGLDVTTPPEPTAPGPEVAPARVPQQHDPRSRSPRPSKNRANP